MLENQTIREDMFSRPNRVNKDNQLKAFLAATQAPASVEALASQALSQVVSETRSPAPQPVNPVVTTLTEAVLSDDPDDRTRFTADLLRAGVTSDEFIWNYATQTARHLGDLWQSNEISFVDVTIGTARLQETVRRLSGRHPALSGNTKRPEVLLTLPADENHCFGLMVAATKFEALGCRVRLAVGHTTSEIANVCKAQKCDMIGISLSHRRHIGAVRQIVESIKRTRKAVPVVLGGGLTLLPDLDCKDLTKADHICSDAGKSLEMCNIVLPSLATTSEEAPKHDEES